MLTTVASVQDRKIKMESKLDQSKIDRINELGRLSKERELTPDERAEQQALRLEYLAWFRSSLRGGEDKKS